MIMTPWTSGKQPVPDGALVSIKRRGVHVEWFVTAGRWECVGDYEVLGTGWIVWGGGEQPVSNETWVKTLDRAGFFETGLAQCYSWQHYGYSIDIIAYRVCERG